MNIARGNNIILKLSTATYELVRTALPNFFHRYTNYSAITETVKEENDLIVEESMKIMNRTKDGRTGKSHKYTINMYHTVCKLLVNGREAHSIFLADHLSLLKQEINCNDNLIDALDKEIQDSLYTNCNSGDTMNKRNNNTSNNNSEQTQ